jgi:hypothetical protein
MSNLFQLKFALVILPLLLLNSPRNEVACQRGKNTFIKRRTVSTGRYSTVKTMLIMLQVAPVLTKIGSGVEAILELSAPGVRTVGGCAGAHSHLLLLQQTRPQAAGQVCQSHPQVSLYFHCFRLIYLKIERHICPDVGLVSLLKL